MIAHPHDALALAHRVGRDLHAQAVAERLRRPSERRRVFAAALRRHANRLDAAPLARTTASHP